MNNGFPPRKRRDYEPAHAFCFWKPYKHTRKMAKELSFETIPHFYWKHDKGGLSMQIVFSSLFVETLFFTRPVCSWCTLLVPPLMQLVQSSHASSLYSTRVLLERTTCTTVDAACAIFERLGPFLDPGSLASTNCLADATACVVMT